MRTHIYEQWSVGKLATAIAGAGKVLRDHDIDMTDKLTFANAAAVVSASTEQLLAIMEHRLRTTANRLPSPVQRQAGQQVGETAAAAELLV